jgi:uncharacterized protein YbjT (DUF2867 family)
MYVITGATGNTGSVITNRLLDKKQQVRAIGRSAGKLKSLVVRGAEPFTAELTDIDALTRAFQGAKAVYVMIPPDMSGQNYRARQDHTTEAIASALERAQVKHAVSLSSVGADKTEKTGPVVGLHRMEERLNRIAGLNVLHLRAGYFMENTLAQIGAIQATGNVVGPLKADLKVPMIAARDIGEVAAACLLNLDFTGKQTRELLGERDLNYSDVTNVLGRALNKPGLKYVQLPDDQMRGAFMQSGMSLNGANLILEMAAALNAGWMKALEPRTPKNTTPTSYETFVKEEFLPRYGSTQIAA